MLALLKRLWGILVGVVMIALSLLIQFLLFIIIAVIVVPLVLPRVDPWISVLALMILINSVSCYEYFRKRRVVTLGSSTVHKLAGVVRPTSGHAVMAFFLVPRGIDRIIRGREFTG
jgi:hypothetical protein